MACLGGWVILPVTATVMMQHLHLRGHFVARTPWPGTLGQDSLGSLSDWLLPQFYFHLAWDLVGLSLSQAHSHSYPQTVSLCIRVFLKGKKEKAHRATWMGEGELTKPC